jgi:hypothetical protein
MDGVLVAYHNTARLFGFQYIPLDEMEACLFGSKGRGDRVFQKCVGLMEEVADEIIRIFPEQVRNVPIVLPYCTCESHCNYSRLHAPSKRMKILACMCGLSL